MRPEVLAACILLAGLPARADDISDVLVTDRTAKELGLTAGDTLEIGRDAALGMPRRFRVAGIYRPKADPYEVGYGRLHLRMHLPDLTQLLEYGDRVDRFVVRLRDRNDAESVVADLDRAVPGMRAHTSEMLAEKTSSTFVVVSQFHKAIGAVSMLAGLVFLVALMVLKIEGMRRELGALRLVGISRRTVIRSVVTIAAIVATLGSLVGIALAYAATAVINPLARARYDTDLVFARPNAGIVLLAVTASVLLGLLAGVWVAWRQNRGNALEQIGR